METCSYFECRKQFNERESGMEDLRGRFYCSPGCRAMAALEQETEFLDAREKGIEYIVTRGRVYRLAAEEA